MVYYALAIYEQHYNHALYSALKLGVFNNYTLLESLIASLFVKLPVVRWRALSDDAYVPLRQVCAHTICIEIIYFSFKVCNYGKHKLNVSCMQRYILQLTLYYTFCVVVVVHFFVAS